MMLFPEPIPPQTSISALLGIAVPMLWPRLSWMTPKLKLSTLGLDNSNFQVVFDESRHITGVVSAPFVESMGTVVLLTSNNFLKWLVVLNVGLLLLVAMMVVPQKENWRHVFDLSLIHI